MNEQFQFSIHSLLSQRRDVVHGPMSPMLFAREMAESVGFQYNRLARVWFTDEQINQHREDGGLTGHDTLIIGAVYPNDLWLSLWVDSGVGGVPVAMVYQSDGIIDITNVYREAGYARNLTADEITEIFDSIFADPGQLNIKSHESVSKPHTPPAEENKGS
ncbi:hypothetical protein [Mucilaginibacter sp. SJ]|uniref:hypothetical protein n=1 Tax=Mucilaginibacter sp. SJ TaxID=3029053 RepID=UPI0023A9FFC0|nr:hypothetical protein [Mucilaginibacter sp. SJ]WEA00696.1 hypothetical protein MusilaSJ_24895 [Mucilaginibacter sp. SJ]